MIHRPGAICSPTRWAVDGPDINNDAGCCPLVRTDPDGRFFNPCEEACLAGPNPVCAAAVTGDILTTLAGLCIIAQPRAFPEPPSFDVGKNSCSREDRKEECVEQWERDTKWCDGNFRGRANVACHDWANDELEGCLKGTPRQPFRR